MFNTMDEMSKMSRWFRFLVKICLIPLTLNMTTKQVRFKIWSRPTAYFLLYLFFVTGFGYFSMFYTWGFKNIITFWINLYQANLTDFLTFAVLVAFYASTIIPIKHLYCIPKISNEIVLDTNLKWPKHGALVVLLTFLCISSQIILIIFTINSNTKIDQNTLIWISLVIVIELFFSYFIVSNIFLFYLSWLEQFSKICNKSYSNYTLDHAENCLYIYKSIQDALSFIFLDFFIFGQVIIVITLYMCISTAFFGPYNLLSNMILTFCYGIIFLHFGISLYVLIMATESTYISLQKLVKPLKIILMKETNEDTKINAQLLIHEIKNTPPLNGYGYFELKRDTLTSITSTTVTYLVILLQFRNA